MTADTPCAHRLAVFGAGVMGKGIATLALGHGVPVVLVDVDQPTLDRAREEIDGQLRHAQLLGVLPAGRAPGALVTSMSTEDVAGASVVVEAIVETSEAKVKLLGEISAVVRPGTPLITNTSGIPIDELAEGAPRPQDVVGTHFMNPPYLIKMVEVIRGVRTGAGTLEATHALLGALGRRAVVVRDAPGFVTSRLLHPMINTAARIVEAGTATAEDVDTLMCGCLGHPTGPLRTADLIGIDNLVDSLVALHERTGDDSCVPCGLLLKKVRDGDLGRKSGRGFYPYDF